MQNFLTLIKEATLVALIVIAIIALAGCATKPVQAGDDTLPHFTNSQTDAPANMCPAPIDVPSAPTALIDGIKTDGESAGGRLTDKTHYATFGVFDWLAFNLPMVTDFIVMWFLVLVGALMTRNYYRQRDIVRAREELFTVQARNIDLQARVHHLERSNSDMRHINYRLGNEEYQLDLRNAELERQNIGLRKRLTALQSKPRHRPAFGTRRHRISRK